MWMEEKTAFKVDKSKCIKCWRCINVCTWRVLKRWEDWYPYMKSFERFGWSWCWRCQHCLAVCPVWAISIFHKNPEDSFPKPSENISEDLEKLVANRRTCRRYLKKNVDKKIIDDILKAMGNVPTWWNAQNVEYTIIDDIHQTRKIRDIAYSQMEQNAKNGIYSSGFSKFLYQKMKDSEKDIRKDDMLFCWAPHLFIAHQRVIWNRAWDSIADCNLATAYFELLANSKWLWTVIMSYSASVLNDVPEAKEHLWVPKDHYMWLVVWFGYPEIEYARGVQRDRKRKIHRWSEK